MQPLKQVLIEEIQRTNKQVLIQELQQMDNIQLQRKLEQEILNKRLTSRVKVI